MFKKEKNCREKPFKISCHQTLFWRAFWKLIPVLESSVTTNWLKNWIFAFNKVLVNKWIRSQPGLMGRRFTVPQRKNQINFGITQILVSVTCQLTMSPIHPFRPCVLVRFMHGSVKYVDVRFLISSRTFVHVFSSWLCCRSWQNADHSASSRTPLKATASTRWDGGYLSRYELDCQMLQSRFKSTQIVCVQIWLLHSRFLLRCVLLVSIESIKNQLKLQVTREWMNSLDWQLCTPFGWGSTIELKMNFTGLILTGMAKGSFRLLFWNGSDLLKRSWQERAAFCFDGFFFSPQLESRIAFGCLQHNMCTDIGNRIVKLRVYYLKSQFNVFKLFVHSLIPESQRKMSKMHTEQKRWNDQMKSGLLFSGDEKNYWSSTAAHNLQWAPSSSVGACHYEAVRIEPDGWWILSQYVDLNYAKRFPWVTSSELGFTFHQAFQTKIVDTALQIVTQKHMINQPSFIPVCRCEPTRPTHLTQVLQECWIPVAFWSPGDKRCCIGSEEMAMGPMSCLKSSFWLSQIILLPSNRKQKQRNSRIPLALFVVYFLVSISSVAPVEDDRKGGQLLSQPSFTLLGEHRVIFLPLLEGR